MGALKSSLKAKGYPMLNKMSNQKSNQKLMEESLSLYESCITLATFGDAQSFVNVWKGIGQKF